MEPKRHSVSGRVASPRSPPAGQVSTDQDAVLSKAIGARVRINTVQSQVIEGTLFTVCPITNVVAINAALPRSNPAAPQPGDYHVIPKSQIQFVQVLSLAGDAATEGGAVAGSRFDEHALALSRVDMDGLRSREEAAIQKMKERDRTRGKGVTKEAQDIFDWFARTLPARWDGQSIIVNDSVRVDPPYSTEDCKAPKDRQPAEVHVRKVLEGYYRKKAQTNSNAGGANRPVMPAVPRKGG